MDKLNKYKVTGNYIVDGIGHHGEIVELTETEAFWYVQNRHMRLATDEEIAEWDAAHAPAVDAAPTDVAPAEAPAAIEAPKPKPSESKHLV
jgi:hypothetical protein